MPSCNEADMDYRRKMMTIVEPKGGGGEGGEDISNTSNLN